MSKNNHDYIDFDSEAVNRNSQASQASGPLPSPHSTPTSPSSASSSSTIANHLRALTQLDDEYIQLNILGDKLHEYLNELEREERSLKLALEQSSTSLREQREKDARRKEDMALARLEAALMADSDSCDGSSGS
mmetsp:Transcript_14407/g.30264  ORF Transcript_14407/g.30264 Transcript_14407/m.30264 type:complete len:134 (+) Transcript_14407:147-548(+)